MTRVKKQKYLCVDLDTRMQDHDIRMGETRKGVLTMVEDRERFSFEETVGDRYTRNPLMWRGNYLNVHRDKQGCYQVNFRKMVMNRRFNPARVAKAIYTELETAKKVLGL